MGDIKVNYSDVQVELEQLKQVIQTLEPVMPKDVGQGNELDVVKKMNMLNQQLNDMVEEYKVLLLKNVGDTEQIFHTLKEAEDSVKK